MNPIKEMEGVTKDLFDIMNQVPRPEQSEEEKEKNEEKLSYTENAFKLIESYFKGQYLERLVRHQLESYNNFVGYQIVKTIEMFNPVRIVSENDFDPVHQKYALEIILTFENFQLYRPQIHENNGAIKLMFPNEARLRNFTYASSMTVDLNIKYVIRSGKELEQVQLLYKTIPKIHIGKLPIMLKSSICVLNQYKHVDHEHTGECKMDTGGYFIINGSEKTVLGQERAAENKIYVFNVAKNNTKFHWLAEVKSVPDDKCISPKQINMMISSKNNGFGYPLYLQIPRVKQPVPLFIVFRALGILTDKEICEKIILDINAPEEKELLEALHASIIDANKHLTQEECIRYITSFAMYTPMNMDKETGIRKKFEFTMDILNNDLFPHCQTKTQKIYFLGYMAKRLLMTSFDKCKQDDRDSYLNKRIDLTGSLLNNLFRNYFNKLVKDMEKQIIKEINTGSWRSKDDYENIINLTNIYKIVKSTTIENGLKRALATGDFGLKHTNSNKVGVAQVLNRLTYVSSLSHLRRISTPIDKSGKLIPPRKLHSTSFGFACPAETPEGQSVGVVKNLSYMTHITIYSNPTFLYEWVKPQLVLLDTISKEDNTQLSVKSDFFYNKVKVFINGKWLGITEDPENLYKLLKEKKNKGIINIYCSIIFDYRMKEIRICNDAGRMTRPLLRVKNGHILFTDEMAQRLESGNLNWNDLLIGSGSHLSNEMEDEAVLEYVDAEEQSWSMIAVNPDKLIKNESKKDEKIYKHTHCEIHPSTIFGILSSCIPFPEHNQSPRVVYQCAQGKQAMGIYATNYEERMDKTAYILNYPMRPMVDTRIMDMIHINKIPAGSNVIVAIMTHTGYNQEDSLLFNKGSVDRGLFVTTIYHTEKDEDKQKINGDEEIRCKPDRTKTKGMKMGNYDKVNGQGVIPENTLVENRDIIISKIVPIKENKNDHTKLIKYEDQSKIYRTAEETFVDKNYIGKNGEGYNFAKVRLRTVRKPNIGDKFSSRHGQKGTIGNIIPECDMPFTKNGVKPDIIINPHAIPSRMTIGQLKETALGKVLVQLGLFGDGTSFGDLEVSDICKELIKVGYEAYGNELLHNGLTGEQHECSVFMGPVFYQRLKHMVNDKTHSRSIGPMVNLTRQPAEGRSRDGGLRFGEMERDCQSAGTPLSFYGGLSIKIENMEKHFYEVLGWSQEKNGIVKAQQSGFMYKGERDCVDLILQDGRKITCTPDHPVLTSNNEWVKVKDLIIGGETRVKAGVNYPLMDVEEEIKECKGWNLKVGQLLLKTSSHDEYLKTLAFIRILGYLITDGSISNHPEKNILSGRIFLGHMLDVKSILNDLKLFCPIKQTNFKSRNLYFVHIPNSFLRNIVELEGILFNKKVNQPGTLPEFLLSESCPRPIIREFLGGLFGGDGHTCSLGLHRGKRDTITSISFSQTKSYEHVDSLIEMMQQIKHLLSRCGIEKVSIQNPKETTLSKAKEHLELEKNHYQVNLHLELSELIPFSEKIGFRYCCHKSQRLEAGVSYRRLRNEVERQHNWLVNRVDELTNFKNLKREFPNKKVPTKKAILQAVKELKEKEGLLHEYAIPSTHDITDHLVKGTEFGKFTATGFPTAEEFLRDIGALDWFFQEEVKISAEELAEEFVEELGEEVEVEVEVEENQNPNVSYGVDRESESMPTMNLTVVARIPVGLKSVYDIQVDEVHSFLANGIVAHNCMISHGAARFNRERLYDVSDKYSVHVCKKCGLIASYNDKMNIHLCRNCDNRADFAYVEIPYACKLLFQELTTMNISPRLITSG
jgi:DNA-directed RNA polymerase II subunit RPB2